MTKYSLILLAVFLLACKPAKKRGQQIPLSRKNEWLKERSPAIDKWATFIDVVLKVYPFNRDSIIVFTSFTNNGSQEFKLYKPLLPDNNMTENLFSVLDKKSYDRLKFNAKQSEKHLLLDSHPTEYIVPQLRNDSFVDLRPGQTMEMICNIAKKYNFNEFLKNSHNQFSVIYMCPFPFVVNNKQVYELDPVDHKLKPVYYFVSVKENSDPDKMRVFFKISQ